LAYQRDAILSRGRVKSSKKRAYYKPGADNGGPTCTGGEKGSYELDMRQILESEWGRIGGKGR